MNTLKKISKLLSVISCLFVCSALCAQDDDEFNVSLADKVEETGIVHKNQWQLEAGYIHTFFKNKEAATIGQFLARYGLTDKIEVRLQTEQGRQIFRYMDETVQSNLPLSVGGKWKLLERHPVLPDITFVGYVNIPVTATVKQPKQYWSPLLFLAFQKGIGDKISVDVNAGGQQEAFGVSWSTIANGAVHYKVTDEMEAFGEYFAQYAPQQAPEHSVGAGLTYSLSHQVAVYASGGSSIFKEDPNWFLSGGLAFRFQ